MPFLRLFGCVSGGEERELEMPRVQATRDAKRREIPKEETPMKEIQMRKTMPWSEPEFIKWKGYRLCYTRDEFGDLVVRFPGGLHCGINALKDAVYPDLLRKPEETFV
jgi:hypothetical protein